MTQLFSCNVNNFKLFAFRSFLEAVTGTFVESLNDLQSCIATSIILKLFHLSDASMFTLLIVAPATINRALVSDLGASGCENR